MEKVFQPRWIIENQFLKKRKKKKAIQKCVLSFLERNNLKWKQGEMKWGGVQRIKINAKFGGIKFFFGLNLIFVYPGFFLCVCDKYLTT